MSYILTGAKYLLVSIILAAIFTTITLAFKKQCTSKNFAKWTIVVGYFIALGLVAFAGRGQNLPVDMVRFRYNLYLFENLRIAVRNRAADTIIQSALNILMFVPCGYLIPLTINKSQRWRAWIIAPAISVAIEIIQFLTGWGIFDVDDLVCNILGSCLGMLLFTMIYQKKVWCAVALSAAVVLPLGMLSAYYIMPYGLLPQEVINYSHQKPNTVVIEQGVLPQQSANIYQAVESGRDEMLTQIEAIFDALGCSIDYSTKDEYETCVIFRGEVPTYYIWYNYNGTFQLKLGGRGFHIDNFEKAPEENVLLLMKEMGFDLPENYTAEKMVSGNCRISFLMSEHKGYIYDGKIDFVYDQSELLSIDYNVRRFLPCREVPCYKIAEVQKNLLRGLFSIDYPLSGDFSTIEIIACDIEYEIDTKGYYRPVYVFSTIVGKQPMDVVTSAVSPFS